jgi:hypothetical protein
VEVSSGPVGAFADGEEHERELACPLVAVPVDVEFGCHELVVRPLEIVREPTQLAGGERRHAAAHSDDIGRPCQCEQAEPRGALEGPCERGVAAVSVADAE